MLALVVQNENRSSNCTCLAAATLVTAPNPVGLITLPLASSARLVGVRSVRLRTVRVELTVVKFTVFSALNPSTRSSILRPCASEKMRLIEKLRILTGACVR